MACFALVYAAFIARSAFRVDGVWHFSLFDDAMVSMRYARNLADGHGLLWNPGQTPVEGYTNLLWTLWMAVLHLLPVPEAKISLLVMLTSAALLLLNLVVVKRIADVMVPGVPAVAITAVILTGSFYPLIFWSLRGMEVGLLTLLISYGVLLALRLQAQFARADFVRLVATMVASLLTRMDALVPVVILATFVALTVAKERRRSTAVVLIVAIVATIMAVTAFRLTYYGDALPNTYYLKVTGVALSTRVSVGLRAFGLLLIVHLFAPVIVAGAAIVVARRQANRAAVALLAALVLGQCAYSVSVGGDAWELYSFANRYISVVAPALFVLCGVGLHALLVDDARRSAGLLAGMSASLGLSLVLLLRYGGQPNFFLPSVHHVERFAVPLMVTAALAFIIAAALAASMAPFRSPRVERFAVAVTTGIRRRQLTSVLVGCGLIVVVTNQQAATTAFRHNPAFEDAELAKVGERERAATDPRATIAVMLAGNGPYFSHRRTVDLLGKSDRHIARLRVPASAYFRPGHVKVDLDYSVRQLRPDLVDLGLPIVGVKQVTTFARWGYRPLPNGMVVRADSRLVDRRRLGASSYLKGQEKAR
jgi:hypothetical protein